jgi:aryl-alcohol dehydrogenase-like predicted oxidoreductase
VSGVLRGAATAAGTAAYRAALGPLARNGHFRDWRSLALSSVGMGTYLGSEDDATDALYEVAVERALTSGINVIDSAINYRHQRSERAVGRALAKATAAGRVAREGVVVATKGGFLPFDGPPPPGLIGAGDLVGGGHCITPRYLDDQIERSRTNLGLETIDVYYLHNPETQLGEVSRPLFMRRLRAAFECLEGAVRDRRIGVYGTATWSGFRQPSSARDFLSLPDLVGVAEEVGGRAHHFRVIQLPYNLAMTEAFTLPNQPGGREPVPLLEAAREVGLYVMISASIYQGQLARSLPPVLAQVLTGLDTDAQRALQFVRSTPGVGTALVGMKSPAHVAEAAALARVSPVRWSSFRKLFAPA